MVVVSIHDEQNVKDEFWLRWLRPETKHEFTSIWSTSVPYRAHQCCNRKYTGWPSQRWSRGPLHCAESANRIVGRPFLPLIQSQLHRDVEQSADKLPILWLPSYSDAIPVAGIDATGARETKSSDKKTTAKEHEVLQGTADRRERRGQVYASGTTVRG